ncbi:MAG: DUF1365 domain-containing protein [Planctomycetota bacterium]
MSAPLNSAIYRGRVHHRRHGSVSHRFTYDLFMLYLDLDELDEAFDGRWLWSTERANLCSFRRSDYLGDPDVPLKQAVLDRVEQACGKRPDGAVRLATQVRMFGLVFNPVSFYYCFDRDEQLQAIVAEITNTPWNERHAYVLTRDEDLGNDGRHRWEFEKDFHVSPFMGMDHDYVWRFDDPGEHLVVLMDNLQRGERVFDVALTMNRHPLDGPSLARALAAHPFMTGKIVLGIYWQALRLFIKRASFHTHPAKLSGGVS